MVVDGSLESAEEGPWSDSLASANPHESNESQGNLLCDSSYEISHPRYNHCVKDLTHPTGCFPIKTHSGDTAHGKAHAVRHGSGVSMGNGSSMHGRFQRHKTPLGNHNATHTCLVGHPNAAPCQKTPQNNFIRFRGTL